MELAEDRRVRTRFALLISVIRSAVAPDGQVARDLINELMAE